MASPEVLRTVGRYEILREVGRGGMAVVYLARDTALDRDVALKELGAFHAADPAFAERFLRESRVAGSLSHPNIVTVHDYFEHDGIPFISMEYIERGSLRPMVGRLTLPQIAGVLEGLLAGLAHAEQKGIVHRDLKPENLMATSQGAIKIADFGIAKALNQAQGRFLTATGTTVGTPTYMAPEQAMAKNIGPWTDLYATGVIAYELLCGQVPFADTDTPMAILLRHVNDPIPSPLSVKPDLDPRLAEWLEKLLAKAPEDRVQHSQDAWDHLEEIIISIVGPRWRRQARLVERPAERRVDTPKPLTPAPFQAEGLAGDGAATATPPEQAAAPPQPAQAPPPQGQPGDAFATFQWGKAKEDTPPATPAAAPQQPAPTPTPTPPEAIVPPPVPTPTPPEAVQVPPPVPTPTPPEAVPAADDDEFQTYEGRAQRGAAPPPPPPPVPTPTPPEAVPVPTPTPPEAVQVPPPVPTPTPPEAVPVPTPTPPEAVQVPPPVPTPTPPEAVPVPPAPADEAVAATVYTPSAAQAAPQPGADETFLWPAAEVEGERKIKPLWIIVPLVALVAIIGAVFLLMSGGGGDKNTNTRTTTSTTAPGGSSVPDALPEPNAQMAASASASSLGLANPSGRVVLLNGESLKPTAAITDPAKPHSALVAGNNVYVADDEGVTTYKASNLAPVAAAALPNATLLIGGGNAPVVAANSDGKFCIVSGTKLSPCGDAGFTPSGLGASPSTVFVANEAAGTIVPFNVKGLSAGAPIILGSGTKPHGPMAIAGGKLFVAVTKGIAVIDLTTKKPKTIALKATPVGVWFVSSSGRIFAPIYATNQLALVDAVLATSALTVDTGKGPVAATSALAATKTVYVVNATDGTVSKHDAVTGRLRGTEKVAALTSAAPPSAVTVKSAKFKKAGDKVVATVALSGGRLDRNGFVVSDAKITDGKAKVELWQGGIDSSLGKASGQGITISADKSTGRVVLAISGKGFIKMVAKLSGSSVVLTFTVKPKPKKRVAPPPPPPPVAGPVAPPPPPVGPIAPPPPPVGPVAPPPPPPPVFSGE